MTKEQFVKRVLSNRRVQIPLDIANVLNIRKGDYVRLTIEKVSESLEDV